MQSQFKCLDLENLWSCIRTPPRLQFPIYAIFHQHLEYPGIVWETKPDTSLSRLTHTNHRQALGTGFHHRGRLKLGNILYFMCHTQCWSGCTTWAASPRECLFKDKTSTIALLGGSRCHHQCVVRFKVQEENTLKLHICLCTMCALCLQRLEEDMGSPGTEVTDVWALMCVIRAKPSFSARLVSAFSCGAISPVPEIFSLKS